MRRHFAAKKRDTSEARIDTSSMPPGPTHEVDIMAPICKPTLIEPWRVFRIMAEFVDGFELLRKYGLAVSFFGPARCGVDDRIFKESEDLAGRLAKAGFTIITGGA